MPAYRTGRAWELPSWVGETLSAGKERIRTSRPAEKTGNPTVLPAAPVPGVGSGGQRRAPGKDPFAWLTPTGTPGRPASYTDLGPPPDRQGGSSMEDEPLITLEKRILRVLFFTMVFLDWNSRNRALKG